MARTFFERLPTPRGNSAPHLLWSLLDGLVWRSRQAFLGRRRVNYYAPRKHIGELGESLRLAAILPFS